jgi:hypothetical protein
MLQPEKIKQLSIQHNAILIAALKQMDVLDTKLLLDFNGPSCSGLPSIGDIQGAIIRNVSLDQPVEKNIRKENRVARIGDSKEDVRKMMLELRTECMPLLDDENNLVDTLFWEDEFGETERKEGAPLNIPVVIMAGGFGSRLKPLTNIIPKPLVPIG